jgi:hypothetical protein
MNGIDIHQTKYYIDVPYAIVYETKLINKYQLIYLFILFWNKWTKSIAKRH